MHRRAGDRAAPVRVRRPVRAVSQLALDLPRAWPCDRVLLPRQWHAALGYVLTVPHHTPDGRPVDTYSVGRRVEKLLEPRCRSGELNVQTAREEAAKLAEAIVRAMKPPRARP